MLASHRGNLAEQGRRSQAHLGIDGAQKHAGQWTAGRGNHDGQSHAAPPAPKQTAKTDAVTAEESNGNAAGKSGVRSGSKQAAATAKKSRQPQTIESLEQAITEHPAEVDNYLALAKLYEAQGELIDAERVLRRATSVSGNDLKVTERLEAVQVRRSRNQLAKAESQYKTNPSDDNRELIQRMKADLNRLELGIYHSRADRYPDQKSFRFELAVCLKRAGNFKEAAKYFQEAAAEPRLLAASMLQRGECLQQIRQYQESMRCYLKAAEAATGNADAAENAAATKNVAVEKLALYRAGVLAMGLKDQHQAQRLFARLAVKAPNFRDVNARLDKLKTMGDT